jgi:O-antigen/teichoic acid export membrane protein
LSATITKSLLNSTRAATFSQILRMVVTFGTYAVLRRWVEPGAWGIWHWSEPLFLLLGQVRDLGLPGHVVRLEQPRPYGNLLRIELIWGLLAGILVVFGAPQLALLFKDPSYEVVHVVQALALFMFFEGLAKVPLTWCEAELQIGRSVPAELARNFTFAVVALSLGWHDFGVWSLVVAHIAGGAMFAAVLWWRTWGSIEFHFSEDGDSRLLKKSLPLVLMSLLVLLTGKIDPWVLGIHFDAADVGRYGMVLFLSYIIAIYVALPVSRALYPALSGLRDDHRFFGAYRLATLLLLAVEVLAALGLFVNAEVALLIFGGEEYLGMAPVLRILCFAPLVQPFSRCANDMLLNLHKDVVIIVSSGLTLVSLVGLGYFLSKSYGLAGMAWANLLPVGSLVVTWAVWRVAPVSFWRLLGDLLMLYLVPLPFFGLAWWVAGENLWLRLGLSLLAAGISTMIYQRRHQHEFRAFFQTSEE